MKTRKVVKALNIADNMVYDFSPKYRCGSDPKHMHAPPNFTDTLAFSETRLLEDVEPGEEVFIEWANDRFYAVDLATNEFIPGPTVWRRSRILEHITVPNKVA